MDYVKIGNYIKNLRKSEGLTQKELAEKLGISFQAVSKWERGDTLPDTGLLPELCDILNTTADKLLNGGAVMFSGKKQMHMEDVMRGFDDIEDIGRCFGRNCDFFTGMVDGINSRMNIDLLEYMQDPKTREVLWAEVIIQGILAGRTVDMDEVEACFTNKKMIAEIRKYHEKQCKNTNQ